jgi:hypothetical protein
MHDALEAKAGANSNHDMRTIMCNKRVFHIAGRAHCDRYVTACRRMQLSAGA